MVEEGVDILDIGGASSAPNSPPVPLETEQSRVVEIVKRITQEFTVPISVDTQRSQVAQVALSKGASIVNDVSGLKSDPLMSTVIKDAGASCVMMASQNSAGDCKTIPQIIKALEHSLEIARLAGIPKNLIVVDPGIGFGKPYKCDLEILRNINELRILNQPILLGLSRKNVIGRVLGYPSPESRLFGTLGAVAFGVVAGIHAIRTHDVRATKDCIKMVEAIQSVNECV